MAWISKDMLTVGWKQAVSEGLKDQAECPSYLNKHDSFGTGQVQSTIFPFTMKQENPDRGISLELVRSRPLPIVRINPDAADSVCR